MDISDRTEPHMFSTYGCRQCHDCISRFECYVMVYFRFDDDVETIKKRSIFLSLNSKKSPVSDFNVKCFKGTYYSVLFTLPSEIKKRLLKWLGYNYQTGEIHADNT